MSISASWLCVKGVDRAVVLDRLGLVEAGDPVVWSDFQWCHGETPQGWLVVFAPDMDYASAERVQTVSVGGEAIACALSEVVMWSSARAYRDGQPVWAVEHDPDRGDRHLAVEGEAPASLAAIRTRRMAEQDACDAAGEPVDCIFSIPADLVHAIAGFRADNDPDQEEDALPMTALVPPERPRRPGLLARLFGRR